jgi:hypothetical protein
MAKEELIASIRRLNPTASNEFLSSFSEEDLIAYLRQLQEISRPARPSDSPSLALAG